MVQVTAVQVWVVSWKPKLDFYVSAALVPLIEAEKDSQLNKHLYQSAL